MRVKFETDGAVKDISDQIMMLRNVTSARKQSQILERVGKTVKARVERAIDQCRRTVPDSYKKRHEHIRDDVVYKVKSSRRAGGKYVSISGGRSTWRLWHLVNDGHVQDGIFTPGNHFIDRAVTLSEDEVMRIIDEEIGAAIK